MFYHLIKLIHMLALIYWIGGMAFLVLVLDASVQTLAPAARLTLLRDTARRFHQGVVLAIAVVLVSGMGLISVGHISAGKSYVVPMRVWAVILLGIAMVVVFAATLVKRDPPLHHAVAQGQWDRAAQAWAALRRWTAINLALAVATAATALLPAN